ncbi:MAG: hypothetical protein KatS3mg087_1791 [Patescibacteria group bacterium]|nr:MAG: hypothetical protein KatS3mg087_1791 [Patescibacteria group bacterium]
MSDEQLQTQASEPEAEDAEDFEVIEDGGDDRVKRANYQAAKYRHRAKVAEQRAKELEQKLSELEPLKSVVPELQGAVQTIKQQLEAERQQRAQVELHAKKVQYLASAGLPADLADVIVGETDEQLQKAIEKLQKSMPPKTLPQGHVGLGANTDGVSRSQEILQRIKGKVNGENVMSSLFSRPPTINQ